MKSIAGQLRGLFQNALVDVLGEEGRDVDPLIRPAGDPKFGDYQSNVAMSLAKRIKAKPRDVAQRIVDALTEPAAALCEPFEIAGPGFINIRIRDAYLQDALNAAPAAQETERLGVEPVADPRTVVVDYSSPNVAKQMHVGHLRSSIIGDTFVKVLEFEGHRVIRQNHIGDWGKQFGMLIAHLKDKMPETLDGAGAIEVADLEAFYKEANARAAEDEAFQVRARAEVVALHQGDPTTRKAWESIVEASRQHYMPVYQRLGVSLSRKDERGESFYNDRLPGLVEKLESQFGTGAAPHGTAPDGPRIAVAESDGALCIFHADANGEPLFKNPEGNPFPLIIRKSDGAFLYATTDLAAMDFRIHELGADRIIYVTDARQAQHFEMVFAAVRAIGWTQREGDNREVQLEHASFGSILGEDRKPLKTRSGENIKLADLLDEAVNRAETLIRANEQDPAKQRGFTEDEINDIAEAVGIGAVKYADLSQNRQSDYVFSWDKMLAMEGNTAPYMMYAYARVRSIYRKGAETDPSLTAGQVAITESAERMLARQILRFAETIESVGAGLRINLLTDYLYDLAGAFMKFYESCPVLGADSAELRGSRLKLCELTARTLKLGLQLLGIRVVERM